VGFLHGKSTVTGLLTTTYNWLSILEGGGEIGVVFFDLKKLSTPFHMRLC